jgi:hypothetical protein
MRSLRLVLLPGIAALLCACAGSSTRSPTEQQAIIDSIESTDALPMACTSDPARQCNVDAT